MFVGGLAKGVGHTIHVHHSVTMANQALRSGADIIKANAETNALDHLKAAF